LLTLPLPPPPTLFPYTTLFRSLSSPYAWDASKLYSSGQVTLAPEPGSLALLGVGGMASLLVRRNNQRRAGTEKLNVALATTRARSEEHTSELQSRSDLVCRLLL